MKRCTKCGEEKELAEFVPDTTTRDGCRGTCRKCHNAEAKRYRDSHPEMAPKSCHKWRASYPDKPREYKRSYYSNNKELLAQKAKSYRQNHLEELRQASKRWQEANAEHHRFQCTQWKMINRDRATNIERMRRGRKAHNSGQSSMDQVRARWDYYGGRCYLCGKEAEQIDHVKPVSKGGPNWPCNLRPICAFCNYRKKAIWPYSEVLRRMTDAR